MYKPSFKIWIKKFKCEDTPIGDLARDIKIDKTFPSSRCRITLENYLLSKNACSSAMDAFNEAFELYKKSFLGGLHPKP